LCFFVKLNIPVDASPSITTAPKIEKLIASGLVEGLGLASEPPPGAGVVPGVDVGEGDDPGTGVVLGSGDEEGFGVPCGVGDGVGDGVGVGVGSGACPPVKIMFPSLISV